MIPHSEKYGLCHCCNLAKIIHFEEKLREMVMNADVMVDTFDRKSILIGF